MISDCSDRLVDPLFERVAKDTIDVNIESRRSVLDNDRSRLTLVEETLTRNDFFGSPSTGGIARVEDDCAIDTTNGDVEEPVALNRGNNQGQRVLKLYMTGSDVHLQKEG